MFCRNPIARLLLAMVLLVTSLEQEMAAYPQENESPGVSQAKRTQHDLELDSILDLAAGAPPEFGADVLIQVVESKKIADRMLKIRLLEEAVDWAERVQHPVKLAAIAGTLVDSRSGYLASAYQLNLDRLSLQSRAVDAMLLLDYKKARELYQRVQPPALSPLECGEPLVYDLKNFYQTLVQVLNSGYSLKERREGRRMDLLHSAVTSLSSHAQVAPLSRAIGASQLTHAELTDAVSLLMVSLNKLKGDAESFSVLTTKYDSLDALTRLLARLEAEGIASGNMLQAIRTYVVSNLRDKQCPGTTNKGTRMSLPEAAADFNELFGPALQSADMAQIRQEELEGGALGPAPQYEAYWQSSPARDLMARIKKLRFGNSEVPLTEAERITPSWSTESRDFLADLESWQPKFGDDVSDYFHQKCVLYTGLIKLMPAGHDRSVVIRSFVEFLSQNSVEGTNRIEWFWHAKNLLERAKASKDASEGREILEAFMDSRNVTLYLYAQLARWAPKSSNLPSS